MGDLSERNAVDVLEEFLLDIMERIPPDLETETKALQNEIQILETQLARVKRQNQAVSASLERLAEIVDYFKRIAYSLGDTSMRATVIRPLINKFRELAAKGELNVGFTDAEWADGLGEKDS